MIYLSSFHFPSADVEFGFFNSQKLTCYDSFYPFQVLSRRHLELLEFEPVTILYGGNGSGKTTVLNIIAETLHLKREALYNRSVFFEDYTRYCDYDLAASLLEASRVITSDDVFNYMLNLRSLNEGIDEKREELFQEFLDAKYSDFHFRTMEDFEELQKVNLARRKTQSKYVRSRLMDNVREQSNGESAFRYFVEKIGEDGLYLLDEPENSLSPARQQELVDFLESSARFFGCQFIIATHSPFLLAMRGAKIYDLDGDPAAVRKWTQLENVRAYYDFFKRHEEEF